MARVAQLVVSAIRQLTDRSRGNKEKNKTSESSSVGKVRSGV